MVFTQVTGEINFLKHGSLTFLEDGREIKPNHLLKKKEEDTKKDIQMNVGKQIQVMDHI